MDLILGSTAAYSSAVIAEAFVNFFMSSPDEAEGGVCDSSQEHRRMAETALTLALAASTRRSML
jgi:hypothetical protein